MDLAQEAWGPSRITDGATPAGFGLALPTAGPLATAANLMTAAELAGIARTRRRLGQRSLLHVGEAALPISGWIRGGR